MSLPALHMALRFRSERGDTPPGMAMRALRQRIADEDSDGRLPAARVELLYRERSRIEAIGIDGMPPSSDDVALLIDALAFRLGETARAPAWRACGISPREGADLLGRGRDRVTYPIFHTIRDLALKED